MNLRVCLRACVCIWVCVWSYVCVHTHKCVQCTIMGMIGCPLFSLFSLLFSLFSLFSHYSRFQRKYSCFAKNKLKQITSIPVFLFDLLKMNSLVR